ncbi:triose-phosphate isomerase [Ancylobacter terrae]|uniref:triose-phosphate isomerase n=1 Tax=Ancylobacter sp. sgz301288 TaxID=3342077 RepID=UPI003859F832
MTTPRPLIAGNWKMNGLKASLSEIADIVEGYDAALRARADLLICPPATLIAAAANIAHGSGLAIGAQDCHTRASGAHTGEISAEMIADAGGTMIIVGHSERRADHNESDFVARSKAEAVARAGLKAIVCVGETLEEREAGYAQSSVEGQLANSIPEGALEQGLIVAYEPVWAIGTGRTPTPADVESMHGAMRAALLARFGVGARAIRLLYGGSVKPDNARELLAVDNVDGALVGGASLKAADFLAIARACL